MQERRNLFLMMRPKPLKPLLFYEGDTSQILEEDDRKIDQKTASKKKKKA